MSSGQPKLRLGHCLEKAPKCDERELSDAQRKVLQTLQESRRQGVLNKDLLRSEALGDAVVQEKPKSETSRLRPVRLSMGSGFHVSSSGAKQQNVHTTKPVAKRSSRDSQSSNTALLGRKFSQRTLKDSIYFQTDHAYESYLREELDQQGLFPDLFEKMKVFYISRGDVHALVGICEALPTMIDDPCQVELERAEVYRQLGDLDKSFLYLDKAVRCDPLNIVAIKSLGFCHKQQGEYDLALHWFLKWKELEPQSAEACYQTGMIYFRLKSPNLARNACSQALDIDPKHIMAKSLKDKLLGQ